MDVALVTCADRPDLDPDDRLLAHALGRRGIGTLHAVWDDPAVDWSAFHAIILRSTWDYHRRLPEFLQWLGLLPVPDRVWNPPAMVRWNIRKTYLAELAGWGFPVVPTEWLSAGTAPDLEAALERTGWATAVLKPVVSANAWRTQVVRWMDGGTAHRVLEPEQARHPYMLQPYRESVETVGELSLVYVGRTLTHAVRKIPAPGDFKTQPDFGASVSRIPPPHEAAAIADRLLARLDIEPLYGRVDFLLDPDGQYEIGEVEFIEPSLFLGWCEDAVSALADAICDRVARWSRTHAPHRGGGRLREPSTR